MNVFSEWVGGNPEDQGEHAGGGKEIRERQRRSFRLLHALVFFLCLSEQLPSSKILGHGLKESERQPWWRTRSMVIALASEIQNIPRIAKGIKLKKNQYFNQCIQKPQIWQRFTSKIPLKVSVKQPVSYLQIFQCQVESKVFSSTSSELRQRFSVKLKWN